MMARVLVIDDNLFQLKTSELLLKQLGHEVITASEGVAGLKLAKEHKPHFVITDIFMPDKDGFELIRDIRKSLPALKIIAMSAGASELSGPGTSGNEVLNHAKRLGADAILNKPLEREKLKTTMEGLFPGE